MRRAGVLAIPLLLLALLAAIVSAEKPAETGLPSGAQVQLSRYISLSDLPGTASVESFARARRPWRLAEGLSDGLFGDSSHFRTNSSLTGTMAAGRPILIYPPKEAWCVLLAPGESAAPEPGQPARHETLVLGLHMDMYVGEWIVHRVSGRPDTQAYLDALALIGCDLTNRPELMPSRPQGATPTD